MQVNPLQRQIDATEIAPERLAGNSHLTQEQKVSEASRQFEAILLRQFLSESQKSAITSEFSDNSTASGIYQDLVTNTLADNISKSGTLGLARTFAQQLNHPAGLHSQSSGTTAASTAAEVTQTGRHDHLKNRLAAGSGVMPAGPRQLISPVKQP